jgi:Undecaprenyl-phosphate glucose phosphotransferase
MTIVNFTDETAAARGHRVRGLAAIFDRPTARMTADSLAAFEIVLVCVAALIARSIYFELAFGDMPPIEPYLIAGMAGGLSVAYILRSRQLSTSSVFYKGLQHWLHIVGAVTTGFLLLIAAAYVLKISATYSRGWVFFWYGLALVFVLMWRATSRRILRELTAAGYVGRRIAVVSNKAMPAALAETFAVTEEARLTGFHFVTADAQRAGDPVAGLHIDDLWELMQAGKANNLDDIVINSEGFTPAQTKAILRELSILPVDIWLSTSAIDCGVPFHKLDRLGTVGVLQVRAKPIYGWGFVAKGCLDYVLAAIGLFVLAPLLAAIAIAVKWDSPGPVLFRQRRQGYNEREITVLKFRTMSVLEDGPKIEQVKPNDARITRIGRVLRGSSLDELPQLINVLRGEMSLVGPRPHALAHDAYYRAQIQNYASRFRVKPGITGLAQIRGFRGETQTVGKMQQRVEADLEYIDTWSLARDLRILALTPLFGFVGKNAR